MSFARSIAAVGGFTLVSRLVGFARDILTAAVLGAGPVADAFFVALKLPNLFRHLFAEGAFGVSFVPMFSGELSTRGRTAAFGFAVEALSLMLSVLIPFTLLAILAMPWLMSALAPGFADEPGKYDLAVALARITFPYLPLVSLVALFGGILNSLDRFAPFAAAPILFNLVIILALLGLAPFTPTAGHAMAWGVTLSGIAQLVWMLACARRAGVRLPLARPRLTPRIRRLLKLMGPGAIGAGVLQINIFIDVVLASLLPSGAVSHLYYADRLNQFPLGVVGIAIGTALLPLLARHIKAGNLVAARHFQNRGLEFALALGLPAAAGLAAAGLPIVRVLFERGAFGPEAGLATAWTLAAYTVGIPAYVLAKVLNAGYYAREDTATPVKIAVLTLATNTGLSLLFIKPFGVAGIALGTGLAAWVNVACLGLGLRRRGALVIDARLKRRAPRLLAATLGMALVLLLLEPPLAPLFGENLAIRVGALALLLGAGALTYAGLAHATGALKLAEIREMLSRRAAAAEESGAS